jgi:hypothetical protein
MYVTPDCKSAHFSCHAGKTYVLKVATLVARNVSGHSEVCVWKKSGIRICVGMFGRNLASGVVEISLQLNYFVKKFYKCCTAT